MWLHRDHWLKLRASKNDDDDDDDDDTGGARQCLVIFVLYNDT